MKVVVINGTEVKGCTYNIKEAFIKSLTSVDDVKSFYLPRDIGHFCTGCKICFFKNESLCPHAQMVSPIWQAMLESDLIVFAYPVYALRTPWACKGFIRPFVLSLDGP